MLLALACEEPESTLAPTETTSPTAVATAIDTGASTATITPTATTAASTATAEPVCLEPPPLEPRPPKPTTVEGQTGIPTSLDAQFLFELPGSELTYQWQQVFGTPDGVEFMTGHLAELSDATSGTVSFVPETPGNYRFRLTATDSSGITESHDVDVWVSQETEHRWDIKGAIFADLFGEMGGPDFNIAPEDPTCLTRSLDHGLAGALRVGAGWIGLASSAFYTQISPTPVIGDHGNYLSLADDDYFAAMVGAAKDRGLKVVQVDGLSPGLELSAEQLSSEGSMRNDPAWWEAWFAEWERWIVPRAARAEEHGVDMFVPLQFSEITFRPDVYPQYGDRWRELLTAIRGVYSGTLAMSFVNADERLNFIDAFDAALITVFDGMYISTGIIEDVQNPTMEELIEDNQFFFSFPQGLIESETPIYYVLTVNSSDGQTRSEDIGEREGFQVDFNEQALYYEAFFKVAAETPWIHGVFTERWDWFDQYRRSGDLPGSNYFDATLESSPRSKPAEEVTRLWFSIQ